MEIADNPRESKKSISVPNENFGVDLRRETVPRSDKSISLPDPYTIHVRRSPIGLPHTGHTEVTDFQPARGPNELETHLFFPPLPHEDEPTYHDAETWTGANPPGHGEF